MLGRATYLAMLLPWVAPVIVLHWLVGHRELRARWPAVLLGTLIPTIYLSAADRFALGDGIWAINPKKSVALKPWGLPLEEALFFLVTNLMVAQSVTLIVAEDLTPRLVLERMKALLKRLPV